MSKTKRKHISDRSAGIESASKGRRRVPKHVGLSEAAGRKKAVSSAAISQPADRLLRTLVFRFDCVDLGEDCPWSLANVSLKDQKDLLQHMSQYESMTVGKLRSGRFHDSTSYDNFDACPNKAAVDRLVEQYDAPDSIARFRLSGTKRLYGFLVDNEFHLLWWDPNHEVWPSTKRHT